MDLILYIITMPCGFISTSKSLKLQISTHVHPTVLRERYTGNNKYIHTKSIVHGHKACMDLALPYKAVHFRK